MQNHNTISISSFILLIFTFLLHACTKDEGSPIISKWAMIAVIQDGTDVSEEHNPFGERHITFRNDGVFESGGRPYGVNTGKYIFNEQDSSLFRDSDVGEEDDSTWEVRYVGDTMKLAGTGTRRAERFQLWHVPYRST